MTISDMYKSGMKIIVISRVQKMKRTTVSAIIKSYWVTEKKVNNVIGSKSCALDHYVDLAGSLSIIHSSLCLVLQPATTYTIVYILASA